MSHLLLRSLSGFDEVEGGGALKLVRHFMPRRRFSHGALDSLREFLEDMDAQANTNFNPVNVFISKANKTKIKYYYQNW